MNSIFYLYFLGLNSSISIMDATTSIMFLVLVYKYIQIKIYNRNLTSDNKLIKNPFFKLPFLPLFGIWAVWEILGFVVNSPKVHWLNAYMNLRWMFFIPIVAWTAENMNLQQFLKIQKIKWFYVPILLMTIYAVSVGVLGMDLFQPHRTDLQPISTLGGVRTQGLFDNPMTYAHAFGVMFCLVWAFGLYVVREFKEQMSKLDYYGVLFTVLFSAASLVLTYTRGAWLSISVAILVMSFLYNPKWGRIILSLVCGIFLIIFFTQPSVHSRLAELFNYEQTQNERLTLWKANWMIFKDHPIFGVGHGENFHRLDEYYEIMHVPQTFFKSHAHNQFLHFLAGTGFLGFLFYTSFLIYLLVSIYKFWKFSIQKLVNLQDQQFYKAICLGGIGAVVHIIFGGLFEANFEDTESVHILAFILALFFYLRNNTTKQQCCD